ncbi:MAG: cytoplasmic protein [Desulfatiglandales bacterium]
MKRHSHEFVETYRGLVGYGLDRETNENTVWYYLQKFSDDRVMRTILKRISDEDLESLFDLIAGLLRKYLREREYHELFLEPDTEEDP